MRSNCLRGETELTIAAVEPSPLLEARGVSKTYGNVVANQDVSIRLGHGEIVALLGENGAGKSTLCSILSGMVEPDAGSIAVRGEQVTLSSAADAHRAGIGMVHQHFMLVPTMTVAENVALGLPGRRGVLTDVEGVARRIVDLARQHGLAVDPHAMVSDLAVGERQRVEILKLLVRGADVLILDEPTAVLTPGEWGRLAEVLRHLAARGHAIVLVTHKLSEALELSDRCYVLRGGRLVGEVRAEETDERALASLMVGLGPVPTVRHEPPARGDAVLEVQGLSAPSTSRARTLTGVSFAVHEGEVFGIAGVEGNGQRELVETLLGLRERSAGTIKVCQQVLDRPTPATLTALGCALVPEDRHGDALSLPMTIAENLVMKDIGSGPWRQRGGLLRLDAIAANARNLMQQFDVRAPSPDVPLRNLSGGNQQKVVLARELVRRPLILIAAQPTRGLDVGAVAFVQAELLRYRAAGGAVLLISSELTEVLELSDRVAVMFEGSLAGPFAADEVDRDLVGMLMAGHR